MKATETRAEQDDDMSAIKSDLLVIKWMMGFLLAFQLANFVKLFLH